MLYDLSELKGDRKLVKRSMDKTYRLIEQNIKDSLLTQIYFDLKALNDNIISGKKIEVETVLKQVHSINYDARQMVQKFWNDKRRNKTFYSIVEDTSTIYNKVAKHRVYDDIDEGNLEEYIFEPLSDEEFPF